MRHFTDLEKGVRRSGNVSEMVLYVLVLCVGFWRPCSCRFCLTMGVADGIVEADGEVIYQVKDMKVALSES